MEPKMARLSLPNEPFSKVFLQHFKDSPNRLTFHDSKLNIDADYTQFLQDVHATQIGLQSANSTGCKDCPYVFLLNPCNYEFAVAAFAIIATGRAVVPLGKIPICVYSCRTDDPEQPQRLCRKKLCI